MAQRARRRSFGSITEVSKTKYVVRWVENTPEGRRRKSHTIHGSYKDACRYLSIKEVEHGREEKVPTVGDAYEMWYLPYLEARLAAGKIKPVTADVYLAHWGHTVGPRWESTPLNGVKAVDIQSWLLTLNQGNARISLGVLRSILDLGVRYDVIDINVARRDYEMPTAHKTENSKDIYTYEQACAALDRLHGNVIEPAFILACFGGARAGESLGATLDDVSMKTVDGVKFAYVNIHRQMPQHGRRPLDTLKNKGSVRTALIPEPFCDRLGEIVEERRADGCTWLADAGDGYPLNSSMFNHRLEMEFREDFIPARNLRPSWRTFAEFTWHLPYDCMELLMGHVLPGVSGSHYIRPGVDDLAAEFAAAYRPFLDASTTKN